MSEPAQNQPPRDPVTSLTLLKRAQARDPAAWQTLFELYHPLILYWCRRASLQGADAEDVAQNVFANVNQGFHNFHRDQAGDTFRGWLRTITRNEVAGHYRRNEGRPRAEGGSQAFAKFLEMTDPDDGEEAEMRQVYLRALNLVRGEFEERTWQMFSQTVIDGRSPSDLAVELGVKPDAVRQAKSRVLRRLREEIGEQLD